MPHSRLEHLVSTNPFRWRVYQSPGSSRAQPGPLVSSEIRRSYHTKGVTRNIKYVYSLFHTTCPKREKAVISTQPRPPFASSTSNGRRTGVVPFESYRPPACIPHRPSQKKSSLGLPIIEIIDSVAVKRARGNNSIRTHIDRVF